MDNENGINQSYDYKGAELTDAQRQQGLLALLDDVIKKDEERTQGEWQLSRWRHDGRVIIFVETEGEDNICHNRHEIEAGRDDSNWEWDALFIASASVSHGRNAKITKLAVIAADKLVRKHEESATWDKCGQDYYDAKNVLDEAFSLYPDEILKRYLKHEQT